MSFKKNNKNTNFTSNNYRLVVLNEESYKEKFALRLSKLNVFSASVAVILFIVSITASIIFFTPVKEYIPGYDTTEIRLQAADNIKLLDSVMIILEDYEQYSMALKATISGEEYINKYQSDAELVKVDLAELNRPVNIQDSVLRRLVEREDRFNVIETVNSQIGLNLQPPVNGIISQGFNVPEKHYGIDIVLKQKTPIKSIADGVVIFSEQSIGAGHTVLIFHKNNISSIYKHNHSSSVEKGDFVKSGQIIALSGNTGENTTGPHLHLEIWDDKGPINPEDLITF
tara:strand:- start:1013 stop:1867 length:855 start_codon:yes stop_codon:yes gene_type:complete